jgi:adenylosuccinate lyase
VARGAKDIRKRLLAIDEAAPVRCGRCPSVIERYTRPRFQALWSEEAKLRRWLRVEVAVLAAFEEEGRVPAGTAARVEAAGERLDPARVAAIEAEVRHDVIAFTTALAELAGEDARYVHFGLTSSDVVDTALALALQEAGDAILEGVGGLVQVLRRRAEEERRTLTVGRTHGIFAEPMVFGLKFLHHALAFQRDAARIRRAIADLAYGKLSGAIGTFSQLPPSVEARALERLKLRPEPVATQVLPRDRHAALLAALAILGGDVERLALEVRLLQRSEVREVREPFAAGQKGSSAMPHKQNPVVSERLVGLARLLRAYAGAGFEDVALWHERDISHSSVERVALQDATTVADFMLADATWLVEGLWLDRQAMLRNLEHAGGLVFSQRVLLALTDRGMTREDAYRVVQAAALAAGAGASFREQLEADPEVAARLAPAELAACFALDPYLQHVDQLYARAAAVLDEEGDR